jgi:hypothetical protein
MQYVTEQGRACWLAKGRGARGKAATSEFVVPHQLVVRHLFYPAMSICVVDEARPNAKAFRRAFFLRAARPLT